MNNQFEPTNSNLLGEDFSNFSFRNIFKRRKRKSINKNKSKINNEVKKEPNQLSPYNPVNRILKAIDGLKAQFNYDGDVSDQSINNSYSYLSEISDVNNSYNGDYKKLVNDFVIKYKPLIAKTPSGSTSTVVEKTNLINQIKSDLKKYV